ncbi:hypothetical protein V8F20_000238 [Naviculisporaceae sp. PSN 640]
MSAMRGTAPHPGTHLKTPGGERNQFHQKEGLSLLVLSRPSRKANARMNSRRNWVREFLHALHVVGAVRCGAVRARRSSAFPSRAGAYRDTSGGGYETMLNLPGVPPSWLTCLELPRKTNAEDFWLFWSRAYKIQSTERIGLSCFQVNASELGARTACISRYQKISVPVPESHSPHSEAAQNRTSTNLRHRTRPVSEAVHLWAQHCRGEKR